MRTATLQQAQRMLLAPWQWRRNDAGRWALGLYAAVLALLLGVPFVTALVWLPARAAAITAGTCALLGLVLIWAVQFAALLRLDHPHAARTVPGHTAALRAVAVGLWLAMVACCAVVSAVAGELWLGGGLNVGLNVGLPVDLPASLRVGLTGAVGMGTLLLLLALAIRWWWLWIPLTLGPSFLGVDVWRQAVFGSWAWLQQQWQAQPLAVTLAVLALQALLLPGVFGSGDAAHARAHAGRERLRQIAAAGAAGHKPTLAAYGRWGEWLDMPWQRLADGWLARVCRHATDTPRSVMARAEVVLHGPQHWVRQLSTLLMVQAAVALCFWLVTSLTGVQPAQLLESGRGAIGIGLTTMALGGVLSLPGALWQSRREQALLMLLPGMPQGAALNQAVAWRQMRQCVWAWAALLPALATLVWAGQGMATLAFAAMTLPMSACLWRDVSRLRPASPAAAFVPVLVCVLGGALSLFLLTRLPGALLPWLGAVLLLTAALLAWRWHRLPHLPQALPAGRLA